MFIKRHLLFSILLFCNNLFIWAQVYNFQHIEFDPSKDFNYVSSIIQDERGYMHFGLNGAGLVSYNGLEFDYYNQKNGLQDDRVMCVLEDDNLGFWIGTARGLFYKKNNRAVNISLGGWDKLENLRIFSLAKDQEGDIYVGTSSGIFQIKKYKDRTALYHLKQEEQVFCVYVDQNNIKWIGSDKGLYRFDKSSMTKETHLEKEQTIDFSVKCLIMSKKRELWIGAYDGGVYRLSSNSASVLETINLGESYNGEIINDIVEDKSGVIWLASGQSGLWKFDGQSFVNYNEDNGLYSRSIYKLCVDHENNLWISTKDQKISIFRGEQFINYNQQAGLNSNFVLSIHQDKKGGYWFGSDAGISYLKNGIISDYGTKTMDLDNIYDITEDAFGKIWFASNSQGIICYDGKSFMKYDKSKGISGKSFLSAHADQKGDVWFGTFGQGIYRYNYDKFYHYKNKGMMQNIVYTICELKDGTLLFGTQNGILNWNKGKFESYIESGDINFPVFGMQEDADGFLWVATFGNGILRYKLNENRIEPIKIGQEQGLQSDKVLGICLDDKQDLWVSTEKNVQRFNVSLFNDSENLKLSSFGEMEGFHGKECNPRSIYKDNSGNVWFGTVSGGIKFDAKSTSFKENPKLYITGIKIHNKVPDWKEDYDIDSLDSQGMPKSLLLANSDNYLTFSFVGLTYKNPEGPRIEYRMTGAINEEWTEARTNYRDYPSLIPGQYTFSLRVCDRNNNCSKEVVSFDFRIAKPWYKRLDVIFISVIIFAFSIFFAYRYRVRILEEDRKKLAELVKIQTRDLNDSINYAKRIQSAVLPNNETYFTKFPDSFILFQPKDVVSGDFYWHSFTENNLLIGAIDCTGHGVPGAFMSIIGTTLLNEIIHNEKIYQPAKILNALHSKIIQSLRQKENATKDGMDVGFLRIDFNKMELDFSGALNDLYLVRDNSLSVVKGDYFPVGHDDFVDNVRFTNHKISIKKGDRIYINSDGYQDQFGGNGVKDKKFLRKKYKNLLLSMSKMPMVEQEKYLRQVFNEWKGKVEQTDDILIIGIEI